MFRDRRATPRFVANCAASIVGSTSTLSQDCLVADMSEGGVRLVVQSEVPELFILEFKDGSSESRKCRVVWHLDNEVGAEFV